ncbi:2Fe-2S iron-sulfur cluster-binding protein [Chloroflexota bacterium]
MSDKERLAEVKIFRFYPAIDKNPKYDVYRIPYEGYSVLNILQHIYEKYDKSLYFRSGCLGKTGGRCGACAILVNGIPALCCQKMAEEKMVLEPHPKFEVIKDLVVDFKRVRAHPNGLQALDVVVDETKCVGCRDCVIICPVGIFEIRKVRGKNKAVAVDQAICCGTTCKMCVIWCSYGAINLNPAEMRAISGRESKK